MKTSAEIRVWIAQCLCPHRHCIAAVIDEAEDFDDAQRLIARLDIDHALKHLGVNPWCGICGAPREQWTIELGRTRFRSMAEAEEPIRQNQARQTLTSLILGTHGPKPPGRA